jgi:prepilin-type N-terminal cleavage/methylation domain-containing protein
MNRFNRHSDSGYTLVEVLLVVIILGILSTVALKSLGKVNETARIERTKQTMDRLAVAIAGDPSVITDGQRVSFGYVGDVGALPPNLDALVQNPGSYATWQGPYIRDQFTSGGANNSFKQDGWGNNIVYSRTVFLNSVSGGTTLTRKIAGSIADLTINSITAVITDWDRTPPGTIYKDSLRCVLTQPNGAGATTSRIKYPDRGGRVQFDSVPIGTQDLVVIYVPTSDTLRRKITVEPGADPYLEITLYRNTW